MRRHGKKKKQINRLRNSCEAHEYIRNKEKIYINR